MSAPIMDTGAAAALQVALLSALAADTEVQAHFGNPARVMDQYDERPMFPFAVVERHEVTPADSADRAASEHTITFVTASRHGGRLEALHGVQILRGAIDRAEISVAGHRVVLAIGLYADVFRATNLQSFRGILRTRFILEKE